MVQNFVARALLRTSLSRYSDLPPDTWQFTTTDLGKPIISSEAHVIVPRFNVSHTHGLAACVVAARHDVGIDVENAARPVDELVIARQFLAFRELARIAGSPPSARRSVFLRYWTLREAYLKARGTGIGAASSDFSFDLVPGRPPRLVLENEDDRCWQFVELRLWGNYHLAVAIRRQSDPDLVCVTEEFVPEGTSLVGTAREN